MNKTREIKNLVLAIIGGITVMMVLTKTSPSGLLVGIIVGVSVGMATALWVKGEPVGKTVQGALVGAIFGLDAAFAGPLLRIVAWAVYSIATMYFVSRILASREWHMGFYNFFGLFLAVFLSGILGWLVGATTQPWIGITFGIYLAAGLFRYFRQLGPKPIKDRYDEPVLKH